MAPAASARAAPSRRSRTSIAHLPTSEQIFDEENSTVYGGTIEGSSRKSTGRKLRSKSIGPGGLEALSEGNGNRQKFVPTPRSILKPSIPLSPPKAIPPHHASGVLSPSKGKNGASPSKTAGVQQDPRQSGLDNLANPFEEAASGQVGSEPTRVSLKTEEEQQAAQKAKEKQEILDRRDARRKSLANRRVSFAPEATLHTWDVVELQEDATSSSEATNSTRRASNGTTLSASPFDNGGSDPPSTPPREEIQVAASPAQQQNLHQKKRRRSSGIPPTAFSNPEDFSSSPVSSVGSDDTHGTVINPQDVVDGSDSDEDQDLVEAEETVTGVDNDDFTSNSIGSKTSPSSSTNSSGRLDEALRQASRQASNQAMGNDDDGEMTMEIANDEITNAFRPLVGSTNTQPPFTSTGAQQDQENIDPFLLLANASGMRQGVDAGEEMTMEVTRAFGGIISAPQNDQSPKRGRRKSSAPARRRSSIGQRRSAGQDDIQEDETMEFTAAFGTIQTSQPDLDHPKSSSDDGDEDMTMELTNVVGGVLDRTKVVANLERDNQLANQQIFTEDSRKNGTFSDGQDDEMDMTVAMGCILSPVTERTEPSENNTMDMDITAAVGAILPADLRTETRSTAKLLMEEEADHGQLTRSPFAKQESQRENAATITPFHQKFKASETGSPGVESAQFRSTRRSNASRASVTPKASSRQTTPIKKPTTPLKQLTPQPVRPTTPSKTPPAKNISMRRTSPKKLFKAEIKKAASSTPNSKTMELDTPSLRFEKDPETGTSVPDVILTPKPRRLSGIGLDQNGLGSPRIAAILDRRVSIGDQAESFVPQGIRDGSVRFADPRVMEREVDTERAEEQRRESGRGILQMEADANIDDNDATTSLRDMIGGLTPKKSKLKGRKSLAVGAAKGVLGKRPIELDEDDEDATPKRLKGKERSPVKNVHLPAPPTKSETTGRLGKAPVFNLNPATANLATPVTQSIPEGTAVSPQGQGRFKDMEIVRSAAKPPASFNEQLTGVPADLDTAPEDDRIHLKDFLDMTSIRFMELTTTKRRHTVAPNAGHEDGMDDTISHIGGQVQKGDDRRLGACVVAGASTIPMLELYQHSCRELKKYISEGRSIVREIELDTFEENPPLFREYMTASPHIRSIMDNQFKNVKTHARLLSKAMWYEWRMKLLDGLREGLAKIGNGLSEDEKLIAEQEAILEDVMPDLLRKHEKLGSEVQLLQSQADELANCDQDELAEARKKLVYMDEEANAKRAEIERLQNELKEKEGGIEEAVSSKASCIEEIKIAERIREECRGWSAGEVAALKANVDELESSTGWTITSATGNSLTLNYKGELSLLLTPSSFSPHAPEQGSNSPISLSHLASGDTAEISTTHRFFLQFLRARLLGVVQARTPIRAVLAQVSSGWNLASQIARQVEDLQTVCPTAVAIGGDERLCVTSTLLLRDMQTKVDVAYEVAIGGGADGGDVVAAASVSTAVKVVYGEELKEGRMAEFLLAKIGAEAAATGDDARNQKVVGGGLGGWAEAVRDLETRLKARGKKGKDTEKS